jgi:pimeloyl-ACP methyl ester carboxylesterase/lysophospholipase L1-like esterase
MKKALLIVLASGLALQLPARCADPVSAQAGVRESQLSGYKKHDFKVNGRAALLVFPEKALPGKPWYWRTEFFGHEPQVDLELLRRGFHVGYVDVQNMYGAPTAMEPMDAFYQHVRQEYGLGEKVALAGFSRGGLFAFNWAALHPERTGAVYGDNPVCDFKSWPGGKGTGKGSKGDWDRLLGVYGFPGEAEALAYQGNPVDNLAALAAARVPVLGFCGRADEVVPVAENIGLLRQRYEALGGPVRLIERPFTGHHPHSLRDPMPIADFVEAWLTGSGPWSGGGVKTTPFGYNYHALRRGLPNALKAFQPGAKARVAFLGGSITQMKGWRDLVCQDLRARFPQTEFDFVAAGIGSLGSTPGAFRLERDVLSHGPVDLLVAESAVNDSTNGHSDVEQVRAVEGIVRHTLEANPLADILLLYFVDPEKMADIRKGQRPAVIRNHEKVAAHYGLASLDLAEEVTERIAAGEFTWEGDFKGLHPSPFGHEVYRRAIGRLFDAAFFLNKAPHPGQGPGARTLPAPLDKGHYGKGRLVAPASASFATGWTLLPEWKPADKAGARPGFVGVPVLEGGTPGAVAKLEFEGNAVGLFALAGPDAGQVEYRVDGGQWQVRELFTQWSGGLHLPWAVVLAAGLSEGAHVLEWRVAAERDPRSKGSVVRIAHFLVN